MVDRHHLKVMARVLDNSPGRHWRDMEITPADLRILEIYFQISEDDDRLDVIVELGRHPQEIAVRVRNAQPAVMPSAGNVVYIAPVHFDHAQRQFGTPETDTKLTELLDRCADLEAQLRELRRSDFFDRLDEFRHSPGVTKWPHGEGEAYGWAEDIAARAGLCEPDGTLSLEVSGWLDEWLSSRLAEATYGSEE